LGVGGREAAPPCDHPGSPCRWIGRHLRIYAISDIQHAELGGQDRLWHGAELAIRARRPAGERKPGRVDDAPAGSLLDLLSRRQFPRGVAKAGLGTAALESYSGQFLFPTSQTIAAGAGARGPRTPPDERLTLVNAPGANAYPLINYEYALVSVRQPNPATADALRRFLLWAVAPDETNEKYLEDAHFIALPAHTWVLSHDQIVKIR
jgi:hypothetical protein